MSIDVINDALAISQHVVQHLGTDAVQYLLGIESLTIESWREAYLLIEQSTRNKLTKEAYIKAITEYFVEDDSDIKYCIRNLSLLPGFQKEALVLCSYTASTLHAVKQATQAVATHCNSTAHADLTYFSPTPGDNTSPTAPTSRGESPNAQPSYAAALQNNPAAPTSGGRKTIIQKRLNSKRSANWTYGNDNSRSSNQPEQFKFSCLAFRSGPEETTTSLTDELKRWPELDNIVVEPVSKSDYSTTFRVQFRTPALLVNKWTAASTWPTRICVRPWNGDPRRKLKPIETRELQKKIYIGNLHSTTTLEKISYNMKKIYKQELESGNISKIDVFENEQGMNRQKQLQRDDPRHVIQRSVCVVLTSSSGGFTDPVTLKIDSYPFDLRRFVRPWRGPIPWPQGHQNRTTLDLNW